ncbi:hypothetical protein, partial [Malikia spinosa]|uniref:hypothetical protein n=1 Tax=Malikia spinosa TaxID=86180 RepID=UPI001B80BA02
MTPVATRDGRFCLCAALFDPFDRLDPRYVTRAITRRASGRTLIGYRFLVYLERVMNFVRRQGALRPWA